MSAAQLDAIFEWAVKAALADSLHRRLTSSEAGPDRADAFFAAREAEKARRRMAEVCP